MLLHIQLGIPLHKSLIRHVNLGLEMLKAIEMTLHVKSNFFRPDELCANISAQIAKNIFPIRNVVKTYKKYQDMLASTE